MEPPHPSVTLKFMFHFQLKTKLFPGFEIELLIFDDQIFIDKDVPMWLVRYLICVIASLIFNEFSGIIVL